MHDMNDRSPSRLVACGQFPRRRLLAAGGVSLGILAGCTGVSDISAYHRMAGSSARFRLLISDLPNAIDDFDRLDVTFDYARILRAPAPTGSQKTPVDAENGAVDTEVNRSESTTLIRDHAAGNQENDPNASVPGRPTSATGGAGPSEHVGHALGTARDDQSDRSAPGSTTEPRRNRGRTSIDSAPDRPGFVIIDLEAATVDLTTVVGEKAVGVFDGELDPDRYGMIELHVADVDGIVDGEPVDVKIPSGTLKLPASFDLAAGDELVFVFDISVINRGRTGRYNLLPVIGESGVVGRDVEVEEIESEHSENDDDTGPDHTGHQNESVPAED